MQYPPEYPSGQQPPYYPPQQPNTQYPPQQPYYPQQQPGAYPPYGQPPQPGPYPPQPPFYPSPPPPKKRTGLWVGIGIVVLIFFLCVAAGSHGSSSPATTTTTTTSNTSNTTTQAQPTEAPTPTPKPLKWTAVQTFKGNGEQKTAIFTVPDDWAIVWACNPSSFDGINYNVIVTVYNSDGSLADVAINSICKPGAANGQTEEHQAGQVYLDISSEGDWAVQVLEMK